MYGLSIASVVSNGYFFLVDLHVLNKVRLEKNDCKDVSIVFESQL